MAKLYLLQGHCHKYLVLLVSHFPLQRCAEMELVKLKRGTTPDCIYFPLGTRPSSVYYLDIILFIMTVFFYTVNVTQVIGEDKFLTSM